MKVLVTSTTAVLVTGANEKGNEFCYQFARGQHMDLYNETYIRAEQFRALYPIVKKVYFGETEMTGDQWRDIQCPLSMTAEQIEQWRENVKYVDVWSDKRTEANYVDDMLSGDPERIKKHITHDKLHPKPYSSFPRHYSKPLTAEELENMAGGDLI